MKDDAGWIRRTSRYLFESRWFNVRQDDVSLPTGQQITYTFVEHPGYAMIVPLLDDGRVILERVYRYPLQRMVLECPSGSLDGEAPELAAKRELEEETGWVAQSMVPLGSFYGSTGISDERFYLYLATQISESGQLNRERTEQIELEFVPLQRAVELVLSGAVQDGPSVLALLLAQRKVCVRPNRRLRGRGCAAIRSLWPGL